MYEIRMRHPGKNALGSELIAWLSAELERAGDQPLLLSGSEDAFSAGLNLKEVAASDAASLERMLSAFDALCQRLFEHPAPTVALVNGHAIAGGCVLVQCCDQRIAVDSPKLRIGLNEVALGACYPPATLRIVRWRLPHSAQHEVLLGAGLFGVEAALRLGLIDAVRRDAEEAAHAWLERTAGYPRRVYAHEKSLLVGGVARPERAELARFHEVEIPFWSSEELRARVLAVLTR